MGTYQDVWEDGKVMVKGARECSLRWAAIKTLMNSYNRHFTVLDIGASEGYFSFRAMQEFDCSVVMMERKPLLERCEQIRLNRCTLLQKSFTIADIVEMSKCEHFDVVLCMSVLHNLTYKDHGQAHSSFLLNVTPSSALFIRTRLFSKSDVTVMSIGGNHFGAYMYAFVITFDSAE